MDMSHMRVWKNQSGDINITNNYNPARRGLMKKMDTFVDGWTEVELKGSLSVDYYTV